MEDQLYDGAFAYAEMGCWQPDYATIVTDVSTPLRCVAQRPATAPSFLLDCIESSYRRGGTTSRARADERPGQRYGAP